MICAGLSHRYPEVPVPVVFLSTKDHRLSCVRQALPRRRAAARRHNSEHLPTSRRTQGATISRRRSLSVVRYTHSALRSYSIPIPTSVWWVLPSPHIRSCHRYRCRYVIIKDCVHATTAVPPHDLSPLARPPNAAVTAPRPPFAQGCMQPPQGSSLVALCRCCLRMSRCCSALLRLLRHGSPSLTQGTSRLALASSPRAEPAPGKRSLVRARNPRWRVSLCDCRGCPRRLRVVPLGS